jgi:hypothetical protein
MKTCTKCGKVKSVSEFPVRTDTGKLRSTCRTCNTLRSKESSAAFEQRHPGYFKKYRSDWFRRNKGKRDLYHLKHRFSRSLCNARLEAIEHGYSPCIASKDEIEKAFTGFCFACGIPESSCRRRLCMDHDHITGEFNGWLCSPCNQAAGLLGNSYKRAVHLAEYIKAHGGSCE